MALESSELLKLLEVEPVGVLGVLRRLEVLEELESPAIEQFEALEILEKLEPPAIESVERQSMVVKSELIGQHFPPIRAKLGAIDSAVGSPSFVGFVRRSCVFRIRRS